MLSKLFNALEKTRFSLLGAFKNIKQGKISLDDLEKIEEQLLLADVGLDTVENIIDILKKFSDDNHHARVREYLLSQLPEKFTHSHNDSPVVIMMVGVNGTGKTTSAAKLAKLYCDHNKDVLLIAADTYRAAAIDQLRVWSNRAGVRLVSNEQTKEPSAVLFDGLMSAKSAGSNIIIVDTAGRLHTYDNLMRELEKMHRILNDRFSEFLVKNLITIDSLLGQNSIVQAKEFNNHVPLDGAILTKLDGTAKGGIIFPLYKELGIPVQYIGVGEDISDFELFNPNDYLDGLFGEVIT